MLINYEDITTLAIAFGVGLLVGLQRQHTNNKLAGVRTFTLIAILGVISGFLTRDLDNPYILPVFGICIASLMLGGNFLSRKKGDTDIGQTTEVAALLMFAIGAYLVMGDKVIGVMVGGCMAILLYIKEKLHDFIESLKNKDISAIMTFAGISLIVLPILPNETFGPFDVLNPQNIWLMVTLIVGISVVGYFIYKLVGKNAGLISNAILGGLISSTATTVSYARKSKDSKAIDKIAAFVITGASAVALIRILFEIGIIIPDKLPQMISPLLVEFGVLLLLCVLLFYFIQKDDHDDTMPEPTNPAQFKSAVIFGLLYGLILLAVAFANEEMGTEAMYIVAILSGLTDVDAITLSLSQIMKNGSMEVDRGWRLILLASLSNLFFKGILAAVLGTKILAKWVSIIFGIAIVAGLLIIWLWP